MDLKIGREVYSTPLPSTYNETNISEDLNNVIGWVFRYYGVSLNKSKDPLLLDFRFLPYPRMDGRYPVNLHLLIKMCKSLA